jgi:toxin ParE1/3/4
VRRLVYLTSAERDLASIYRYIARESGSRAVARRFVEQLRRQCAKLSALSGTIGRARPEIRSDIRSFPFRGYLIFFRYVGDALEIVDVLEGHRDIQAHFQSEPE